MRAVVLVVLVGCGRVGFRPLADALPDMPADAAPDAAPDAATLPVAVAGGDQTVPYVPCNTTIAIDPRNSYDPNGTLVSCTVQWNVNSTSGGSCNSGRGTQVYVPGVYPVILEVMDNDGNIATDTAVITVVDAGHPPPTDGLVHWDAGPNPTGAVASPVTFDFSASWNPDGQHWGVAYDWNFGDGTSAGGTNLLCTHSYAASGTYPVTYQLEHATLPPASWPSATVSVTIN